MNGDALKRMRQNQPCVGSWLSIGSPVVSELAAMAGLDWLLLDLEHGCGGPTSLFANLQAVRSTDAAVIVRVGGPTPDLISSALDWGADGIMVPHISSADEAENCLQAIHYAPRGHRGFSRSARTYGYGWAAPVAGEELPKPLFLAQIENIEGVENVESIAQVDGVDVLFIGPADLSFELRARKSAYSFEECLSRVVHAARRAGKASGILVRDRNELLPLREQGFTCLAIDSDLGILRAGYQDLQRERERLQVVTFA